MASMVVVIDATLRQHTMKVQPGQYIIDILEDACRKWNLASDKYQLKHKNRTLTLTDPFRAAGLSPGAKLELVRKSQTATAVTVALRLPESERRLGIPNNRVQDKLRSDTTVWMLLRRFEETGIGKEKKLNLTGRGIPEELRPLQRGSGQLYWEAPVLTVAGRELCTIADFQKTLAQIGIDSGSQLIVLQFRRSELLLPEAMAQVDELLKESEAVETKASQAGPASTPPAKTDQASKPQPQPDSTTETQAAAQQNSVPETKPSPTAAPSIPSPTNQPPTPTPATKAEQLPPGDPLIPIEIIAPSSSATIAAASTRDAASAFTPTAAQMTAHQQSLGTRTHNQRLKEPHELEAEARAEEARLAAIKRIDVRVRFPNGFQLRWALPPDATGASLYSAVLGQLVHEKVHFKLTLPAGSGTVVNTEKKNLIRDYGMKGGVLLNFVWLDAAPADVRRDYLKDKTIQAAHEVVVPLDPDTIEEKGPTRVAKRSEGEEGRGSGSSSKVPKWLKLGKK